MGRVDAAMARAAAARGAAEADGKAVVAPYAELELPVTPPSAPAGTAGAIGAAGAAGATSAVVRVEDLDITMSRKVVVDQKILPGSREQYRRLAAGLHQAQAASAIKVVMVSSAVPGEGKTLTVSNLALTLSESYHRRVLVIDADLRRPSLHRLFKVPGSPGLTESLLATDDRPLHPHQISPNLSLLPAGAPSGDPMAALTSARMRHILDDAREAFDWVIVDTPPIGLLPDASLVAANVDATLFVIKAGETPFELVKRAVDIVGADRLLGVVLNRAMPDPQRYGYGYAQYSNQKLATENPDKR
jgi:protein-tyrosine kinase